MSLEEQVSQSFLTKCHLMVVFSDINKVCDAAWQYRILQTDDHWNQKGHLPFFFFFSPPNGTTCPLWTFRGFPLPGCGQVYPTSEVGTPMRRGYAIPMRSVVIYGYEVPGGTLNLSSTTLPRPWSPWVLSPFRKNPHGRIGNRTRDLMISSQRL